ncbi:bifunctional (p)ppGpp synthetase/guanosine-3',5'-bis(diphosphate) 3'-pyrophosphohydrolase [Christensenellaceae bacterium OttesenSCG-928-L17]|nr:bifunctional (p)ppGpp synthetase/guanosine-3',5'-bis(diphosphate) 3'-pyrophosphohydrolase [Christensenellaceae bacterium OttesenSCG-928-L17]
MDRLYELCKRTFNEEQLALLEKAILFAKETHKDQRRESGEEYYIHPQAVAIMLYEMGMDYATVIAGVLHDVVEDGKDVTVKMISDMFTPEIAEMVDSVTKLTKSGEQTYITKQEQQAENLRKLFLAMAHNIRVVIIKLADRLHNMRTLEYCDPTKRVRKAKETLEVYAPLAHRFGMGAMKGELEDLSFMHMMPEEYESLRAAIAPQQMERMKVLQSAIEMIKEQLALLNIEAEINGRPKHLYSIYRKMVKQNRPLEEIYDLIAIRIIVGTVKDCYATLGVIHTIWKPMPGRFKDYIAIPKTNMYKSLHTTLFAEEGGLPFEVQIRTFEMHRTAEYGIAAHWMYKEGRATQDEMDSKIDWLRTALEYENDADSTKEFIDSVMKDFFSEYVFVLTPRGEILDLPVGSTPLDFAYHIHTNVGHHCQHAKVNGSMVRLDYKLKTNDVVEIITSANQNGPSRDWLNIVKTQQAKQKIRQWFKKANREENVQKGREMLEGAAKRHGQQLSSLTKPEYYNDLLKKLNMSSLDDIYNAIGYGGISTGQVLHRLMDLARKEQREVEMAERIKQMEDSGQPIGKSEPKHSGSRGIIVHGEPNMVVRFAHCCSPVPGDEIIGYITRGRGVSVHSADCTNAQDLMTEPDRIIPVEWAKDLAVTYTVNIGLIAMDRPGVIMDITQALLNVNINIKAINAKAERDGKVYVQLSFEIKNASQLDGIIKNLRKVEGVTSVFRARN